MALQSSVNVGLDVLPSSKDSDNLYDLVKLYNAAKILAEALDRFTGASIPTDTISGSTIKIGQLEYCLVQNICRVFKISNVNLTAGQFVSIDAGSGNLIAGVVGSVVGWSPIPVTAGNYAEIKLFGLCQSYAGLTPGAVYYAVAGGGISTTVSAQKIGTALDSANLFVNP